MFVHKCIRKCLYISASAKLQVLSHHVKGKIHLSWIFHLLSIQLYIKRDKNICIVSDYGIGKRQYNYKRVGSIALYCKEHNTRHLHIINEAVIHTSVFRYVSNVFRITTVRYIIKMIYITCDTRIAHYTRW